MSRLLQKSWLKEKKKYFRMKVFSVFFFMLLVGCNAQKNLADKSINKNFDFQGHRGCRGLMPENTIAAMYRAIDLGVSTLEMDIVCTRDSQLILSHEPFFNHEISTLPNGDTITEAAEKGFNIFQMSYERVQQIDVGLKPHPRFAQQVKIAATKPKLMALIDSVEAYIQSTHKVPIYYNIEIKTDPEGDGIFHPAPDVFANMLMKLLEEKKILNRVTIQSFDIRPLQYLHQQYPFIKTALLIEGSSTKTFAIQLKELGFIPTIYSPENTLVTKLLIIQCHEMGMQIIPWTVNVSEDIKRLKKMGIDGIISDYPDLYNIKTKR